MTDHPDLGEIRLRAQAALEAPREAIRKPLHVPKYLLHHTRVLGLFIVTTEVLKLGQLLGLFSPRATDLRVLGLGLGLGLGLYSYSASSATCPPFTFHEIEIRIGINQYSPGTYIHQRYETSISVKSYLNQP